MPDQQGKIDGLEIDGCVSGGSDDSSVGTRVRMREVPIGGVASRSSVSSAVIEHRLFSHISLNWAGVPLRTFETVVSYIAGTTTTTGLRVKAVLKRGANETGERVSTDEWRRLRLKRHKVCPKWNYMLRPHRRRH